MTDASPSHRSSGADQDLALNLTVAIRTAAYYDAANDVLRQVCSALVSELEAHFDVGESVRIGVHSHCVFVGDTRIRTSVSTYSRFAYLIQLFQNWAINTLTFHAGISASDLVGLTLVMAREQGQGAAELEAILARRGVTHIDVDLLSPSQSAQAVAPIEAYVVAIQIAKQIRESTETGEPADVRQVRHVTQAIVDQVMSDPRSLVALTTIKELDGNLISHSTNVAILSVLLGRRMGMSKSRLGELCLAAFLHDAGKLEIAPDVLYKAGPLAADEWEAIRKHPINAARALLGVGRLTAPSMRAVVVAYEHHLNYDLSGYPTPKIRDHVSLFGNIVAIADRYDAVTTARPYREIDFTPHEALGYLISESGRQFDPTLVKLFVDIMGVYPPGTLVRLNTGDLGVVVEPPAPGRPLYRPTIRLLTGERSGELVDLDTQYGSPDVLAISQVLNPANRGQIPAVDMSLFETGR